MELNFEFYNVNPPDRSATFREYPGAPQIRMPRYNKVNLRNTGQMTIEDAPPFSVTMIFQAHGLFQKWRSQTFQNSIFFIVVGFFFQK